MSDFESARVRDYSKNIKTLSAKYFYDQDLFKLFCDLVDRDMGKKGFLTVLPFTVIHLRLSLSVQKQDEKYLLEKMPSPGFLCFGRRFGCNCPDQLYIY